MRFSYRRCPNCRSVLAPKEEVPGSEEVMPDDASATVLERCSHCGCVERLTWPCATGAYPSDLMGSAHVETVR